MTPGRELHLNAYRILMDIRNNNPEFKFWLRQRGEDKFLLGYIFQGNDNYAFAGLFKRSGGDNKTRSFGIVFYRNKDASIGIMLENAFDRERDQKVLEIYEQTRNLIGGFRKMDDENYKKFFNPETQLEELRQFINFQMPLIEKIINDSKLERELLMTKYDFEAGLKRIQPYLDLDGTFDDAEGDDDISLSNNQGGKLDHENTASLHKAVAKQIAGWINDSDQGDDYLNIDRDVVAFARSMAEKALKPPLAIALFGKWGTGKSFFMQKLKDQIETLCNQDKSSYCEGIVQIHFNAWSYLDANLWASIVYRIFEELDIFIKNDSLAKREQNDVGTFIKKQLDISKEIIKNLEIEKISLEKDLEGLAQEKEKAEKELEASIKKLESRSLRDLFKTVDNEFNLVSDIRNELNQNKSALKNLERIQKYMPAGMLENPEMAYKQIKSFYTFFREFLNPKRLVWNLVVTILILVIIIFFPIIKEQIIPTIGNINFSFPTTFFSICAIAVSISSRLYATIKTIQPLASSIWNIKIRYERALENAYFEYEQKEKGLLLKIDSDKTQLKTIDAEIESGKLLLIEIELKIEHSLSTEALHAFIERRSNSEDYKKHLGIISTIRKDLAILSDLFLGHKEEQNNFKNIKDKFERPLERIILYIDDLDRCSEERVVEVLEAVNLLMSYPLFVVVVGVDPRWIKNALLRKHEWQFGITNNQNNTHTLNSIDPTAYLEKIFQIPFWLKEATDNEVKAMLRNVSSYSNSRNSLNLREEPNREEDEISEYSDEYSDEYAINNNTKVDLDKKEDVKVLALEEIELQIMQNLSLIIGTNPRAIKRFVNTYRIIKAHEALSYDREKEQEEILAMMFLLALSIGPFNGLLPKLKVFLNDTISQGSTIETFFHTQDMFKEETDFDVLNEKFTKFVLADNRTAPILHLSTFGLRKHSSFIERFTFDSYI